MIGLIPLRGGSKRIPGKNTRFFCGHPLFAYTLGAAEASGVFERIAVSTDDPTTAALVRSYGVQVIDCTVGHQDDSCDITWLRHAFGVIGFQPLQTWAILRATSPFRTADTIRRAYRLFTLPDQTADSLRAVEPVRQHPGKMWTWDGDGPLTPLLKGVHADGTPWHSSPTQSLPPYYVQNGCMDMGWSANLSTYGTIHGKKIQGFRTHGHEGHDLNTAADWREAESLVAAGQAVLPAPALPLVRDDAWAV